MDKDNYNNLMNKVEKTLEQLRPYLLADGGNVELLEITEEMIVKVRFIGSCKTCNMSHMTLKSGIQESVMKAVPEIIAVEAETVEQENSITV